VKSMKSMKFILISYLLSGTWVVLVAQTLPHNEWYLHIANNPWSFIVVNAVTLIPVIVVLFITDRLQAAAAQKAAGVEGSKRP